MAASFVGMDRLSQRKRVVVLPAAQARLAQTVVEGKVRDVGHGSNKGRLSRRLAD